ncbi:MAG: C40 family peptidase, partial [Proteobacteria bacterium]|nr:C40 family peptidase [Pseudomonadota bacterium]
LIARERAIRTTRTTADKIGALVVIRNHPRFVNHVGVIVEPQRFLHVLRNDGVVVDHARRPPWAKRIQGFYRLMTPPDPNPAETNRDVNPSGVPAAETGS